MEISNEQLEELTDSYVNIILNLMAINQDEKLQLAMSELSKQMKTFGIIEDVLEEVDRICIDNSVDHPVSDLQ